MKCQGSTDVSNSVDTVVLTVALLGADSFASGLWYKIVMITSYTCNNNCRICAIFDSECVSVGEAVYARCLSSLKDERVAASKVLKGPASNQFQGDKKLFTSHIQKVCRINWRIRVIRECGEDVNM